MGISALLASQILDASATGRSVITGADASAIRTTLGLGTLSTQSPTGTPSASTFLRGDYSWQTIDLSGYVPYSGATGAVNLGSNAFTASRATLSTGTITASTPAINVTQTWNNAATTFTGILANVTDTASNAASLLLDLQVGGTSSFRVRKDGYIFLPPNKGVIGEGTLNFYSQWSPPVFAMSLGPTNAFFGDSLSLATAGIPGSADTFIRRDAANTLAQRNSTNAQTFRVYNTYTDASNYERGKIEWSSNVLRIGTEKAGTGSARALELQTDGTTRLTIATNGNITGAGLTLDNSNSQNIGLDVRPWITIKNNSATLAGYLSNGGSIFSSGASGTTDLGLRAVGAFGISVNNSQTPTITISSTSLVTIADASDIAVGTTTGTKIGTATTQKIGFYNKTPVVQPAAVADATDAASVITQLNLLLSRMRDLGLIAT